MQIIERIQKELQVKNKSVLKLSEETGIPAYRIYKWLDGKGNPKSEDSQKLEEWLRKNVPHGTIGEKSHQTSKEAQGSTISPSHVQMHQEEKPIIQKDYRLLYEHLLERMLNSPEHLKGVPQLVHDLEQKLIGFLSELKEEQDRQRHLLGTISQNLRIFQAEVGKNLKNQQPASGVQDKTKKGHKSYKG